MKYPLSITRGYVASWNSTHALREIIQNALDTGSMNILASSVNGLRISNAGVLSAAHLLLGATSKADDETKIGQFGEGFKLALLVLAREGFFVEIETGGKIWSPSFEASEIFAGAEVLVINESERAIYTEDTSFTITHFESARNEELISAAEEIYKPGHVLGTRDENGNPSEELLFDSKLDVLPLSPENAGKMYVNGLFICREEGFLYGYNFRPGTIPLERDRSTVSYSDIMWETARFWASKKSLWVNAATMLSNDARDVQWIDNHLTPAEKAAFAEVCLEVADREHPGQAWACDNRQAAGLATLSFVVNRPLVHHSHRFGAFISTAESNIKRITNGAATVINPKTILRAWFKANRGHMRPRGIKAFKNILDNSNDWYVK